MDISKNTHWKSAADALSPSADAVWKLICSGVTALDKRNGPKPRPNRVRATFSETALSKECATRCDLKTGVEREFVYNVSSASGGKQVRIDYISRDSGSFRVTCELKGPARPTIFKGSQNFYEQKKGKGRPYGIKPDLLKQHEMAARHPDAEHYVLWILEDFHEQGGIDAGLSVLRRRLGCDLPGIRFQEVARTAVVNDFGPLWLVMSRVN